MTEARPPLIEPPFTSPAFRQETLLKRGIHCLDYAEAWLSGLDYWIVSADCASGEGDDYWLEQREIEAPEACPNKPPSYVSEFREKLMWLPAIAAQQHNREGLENVVKVLLQTYEYQYTDRINWLRKALLAEGKTEMCDSFARGTIANAWDHLHSTRLLSPERVGWEQGPHLVLANERWVQKNESGFYASEEEFREHPNFLVLAHCWPGVWTRSDGVSFACPCTSGDAVRFEVCLGTSGSWKPGWEPRRRKRPHSDTIKLPSPKLRKWGGCDGDSLAVMQSALSLQPWLGLEQGCAFPALLYKCFTSDVSIQAAANAMAHVLGDALRLLKHLWSLPARELHNGDSNLPKEPPASMPGVFGVASCGQFWQVWTAYEVMQENAPSVAVVPLLSRPLGMCDFMDRFRLLVIMKRLGFWMERHYRPAVANRLEYVWQTWLTDHPAEVQLAFRGFLADQGVTEHMSKVSADLTPQTDVSFATNYNCFHWDSDNENERGYYPAWESKQDKSK